jgi:hypothetical protein
MMFVTAYAGPTLKSFPGLLMFCTTLALCAVSYRLLRESRSQAAPGRAGEDSRAGR